MNKNHQLILSITVLMLISVLVAISRPAFAGSEEALIMRQALEEESEESSILQQEEANLDVAQTRDRGPNSGTDESVTGSSPPTEPQVMNANNIDEMTGPQVDQGAVEPLLRNDPDARVERQQHPRATRAQVDEAARRVQRVTNELEIAEKYRNDAYATRKVWEAEHLHGVSGGTQLDEIVQPAHTQ